MGYKKPQQGRASEHTITCRELRTCRKGDHSQGKNLWGVVRQVYSKRAGAGQFKPIRIGRS